ncbi:ArnT family glycosyltransferase [Pseudomonadota bacterium]
MQKGFFTEHKYIVLLSVLSSIFISAWCVYLDPVINNDGIQYIKAAQHIVDGQFSNLLTTYKWPFYPFLIAQVQQFIPVNIEFAAHIVNAGLAVLLVIAFLGLVYELGGNKKTIIAAAVIILLYPSVNELRSEVIRDIGYVAFYLYAIAFLLRYFKTNQKKHLYGWLACMTLSILFRIEGATLLFAWPIVKLLLMEKSQKRNVLLCLFSLAGLLVLVLLFLLWSSNNLYQPEANLSDGIFVYLSEAANQIIVEIDNRISSLQRNFLGKFSAKYAFIVYIFTLLLVLCAEIIATITIFHFILSIVSIKSNLALQISTERLTISFLIGINLVTLLFFTSVRLFLTDRYTLSLSIVLLALSPFAIIYFLNLEYKTQTRKHWAYIVIFLFLIGLGVDGLSDTTNKRFVKQAGLWLKTQSPPNEKLLTNSRILAYYSNHNTEGHWKEFHWSGVWEKIYKKKWREYDYLAIRIRTDDLVAQEGVRDRIKLKPYKIFTNPHGESLLIYKLKGNKYRGKKRRGGKTSN